MFGPPGAAFLCQARKRLSDSSHTWTPRPHTIQTKPNAYDKILSDPLCPTLLLLGVLVTQVWAQNSRTITGKVTSIDDGSTLPGVNVLEKGTTNGTVTDADGNYSILVKENATLVYSFVGFASQEVEIESQTAINITLIRAISPRSTK